MKEVLDSHNSDIDEMIAYLMENEGKMLRPRLVFLAASLREHDPKILCDIATAVELIHMASLVHDDVIDQAMLRRGRDSLNSCWGNHRSVLVGDYFFAAAFKLINIHGIKEIMANITHTIQLMCAGELKQMALAYNYDISEEEYLDKIFGKTACLFASSCKTGALVSSMPDKDVYKLEQFGLCLGYAYQIIDDILDFVSDSESLGKPVGSDLLEGNITLPVIYIINNTEYGPWLKSILADRYINDKHIKRVSKIINNSGAIDYSLSLSRQFLKKGLTHLQCLPASSDRKELEAVSIYLLEEYYTKLSHYSILDSKKEVR